MAFDEIEIRADEVSELLKKQVLKQCYKQLKL